MHEQLIAFSTRKYQSLGTGKPSHRHMQAVPNTMHSSSVDCIVHFRRKYLKGLLSIPSHGRGARRPLGQSFRKSVGPAWELTPHVSFVHALQGEVARVPMKYSCPSRGGYHG